MKTVAFSTRLYNKHSVGRLYCHESRSPVSWKSNHHMVNIQKLGEKAYTWQIVGAQ